MVPVSGRAAGCTALQKGPLWWAAHHRDHHRFADSEGDVHSPHCTGSPMGPLGWFLTRRNNVLRENLVRDWLNSPSCASSIVRRFDRTPFAACLFYLGAKTLRLFTPGLGTSGLGLIVWCFFISTALLYHATYSVNSFAHLAGTRRCPTGDDSRNNLIVALPTLGEGWHNNHHHYPSSRQGFYRWEVGSDFLRALRALNGRA